jgi:FtsP/CotA-like multicopper oxidase with cupredoxin domain
MANDFTRRNFFAMAGGAALLTPLARLLAAEAPVPVESDGTTQTFAPKSEPITYRPVVTPNNETLPWKLVDGVKVFHLVPEPVTHAFAPGLVTECWGYNQRVHGPTIEAVEGDRVRFYVTNRLPSPTTVHWHGLKVPNGMDGVGGLSQRTIQPGETFKYEFTLPEPGSFMYHPHHDEMTQMQLGMMGLFIVHPREAERTPPDRDYALLLSEWRIDVGARRPNPSEMTDFNVFSFNGRSYPGTQPLVAQVGDRVRIRLGNLSTMSHHSIHLHGNRFQIIATGGGSIEPSAQWPESTVFVPTGTTRTVEFVAKTPGDWVMHCHMLHHSMTQMGHASGSVVGINAAGLNREIGKVVPGYMTMGTTGMEDMSGMPMPVPKNSLPMGAAPGPFGDIGMGGMFTIVKVREKLEEGGDPGWYVNPRGTQADLAAPEDMKRDGIDPASV